MKQRKWIWLALPLLGTFTAGIIGHTYLGGVGQAETTNLVGGKGPKAVQRRQAVPGHAKSIR